MRAFILKNRYCSLAWKDEFNVIFARSLFPYWDNITGFDIIKFDDEFIKAPDGVSLNEEVERRYGKRAVQIIKALIHAETEG